MSEKIGKQAKGELLEVLRQRYQQAPKQDKTKILDEFIAVTCCHRKHAIRLLTGAPPARNTAPQPSRRLYDEAVRQALIGVNDEWPERHVDLLLAGEIDGKLHATPPAGSLSNPRAGPHQVGQAFQPDSCVGQAFQPDETRKSQAGKPDLRTG